MAAANFMRSMSHMSSDSEHEDTELERKLSVRVSRRLSAKRRPGSALDRPDSGKAEVGLNVSDDYYIIFKVHGKDSQSWLHLLMLW